jgi:hypothetical protein
MNNAVRSAMSFSKGISPNPDGRKVEAQVTRAARAEGEKCVAALAAVRDDPAAVPELRAKAVFQLLALAKWNGKRTAPTLVAA